ncbi:hypothetical protein [Maioricimonas rarisocia]|nr:hypothetical protein [Maioricimonas rarisocia]
MFRRAERQPFVHEDISIVRVAIVTDGDHESATTVRDQLVRFVPRLNGVEQWDLITGEQFHTVEELTGRLTSDSPDLVVTFRHLQEESLIPQHSLGVYVDVMTQVLSTPVLLLPGTGIEPGEICPGACNAIMVVTDHIAGDSRLINYAVAMSAGSGDMWLCHVEDDAVFDRYMQAIEKIPEIDTEQARVLLGRQLLKDASDFIESAIAELQTRQTGVTYHASVVRGHRLQQYMQLVESHDVHLVVVNTKDEDQLAMHGMAYALSVELNDRPLLLL